MKVSYAVTVIEYFSIKIIQPLVEKADRCEDIQTLKEYFLLKSHLDCFDVSFADISVMVAFS